MSTQQVQEQESGWVGWIYFAGFMMIVGGVWSVIVGMVALFNDEWVVWGERGAIFIDITQWGWIHTLLGLLLILVGLLLFKGNMFARTIAVILAGISLIVNFFFLPAYPFWAIAVMVVDVLVIYAVTAHGRELKA